MSINNKFHRFFKELERRRGKLTQWQKVCNLADYFIENKINKVPMDEYFKYEFYLKNRAGRETFSTQSKRRKFFDRFNDLEERKWFDNKSLFASRFKDFMGRDELNMETASLEEFTEFIHKHQKIFLKPTDGHYGIGAHVVEIDRATDFISLYKSYSGKKIVAEEFINQAPELARFNDSCVNSVRVMTFLCKNNTVDIIPYAAMRIGRKGKVADNFHNDGITAIIDSSTGHIITVGLDKNGNRWVVHPDSKEPIVGFQVPHWDRVCECVRNAALVCPKVRFVGWDVTVTDDGRAILIEGNSRPDPDVIQAVDGIGKWYLFENYLRDEQGEQ